MADVKAGRGPAGVLLRDEAVAGQIRQTVKNAQGQAPDLGACVQPSGRIVSDLNSRQIPQKASDLAASLNDSARQVNHIVSDLTKPDQNGMPAGANIRESLTNANAATDKSCGRHEALKHNFLVRGFFKSRGYYNLADISPEEYRRNRAFTAGQIGESGYREPNFSRAARMGKRNCLKTESHLEYRTHGERRSRYRGTRLLSKGMAMARFPRISSGSLAAVHCWCASIFRFTSSST